METLQRTANSGSVSTGFNIDNSVKVENDNREYLRWTNFSSNASSARKKKFTMSCWLKRTELGRQMMFWSTAANGYFSFDAGDTLIWYQQYVGSGTQLGLRTTRVFRDTSAWYHLMIVVDTAQSTEANRVKMYVNGVQETVFGTPNTYPSQGAEASNLYEQHLLLGEWGGGSTGFSGYIAEYYFLSEIAASPTDLGEFDEDSGIWIPKEYDGTISSPSHFLEFKDGSDLGTATSGLDSDYQNNLAAADQSTDTPTNNFCTFNAINMYGSTATLAEGATFTASTGNGAFTTYGTMAPSSGKWWWEGKIQVNGSTAYACIGATTNLAGLPAVSAQLSGGHVIKLAKGQKWVLNDTGYNYGAQYEDGSIINIGLDLDNRRFYSYKNGTVDDANGIDISSTTFDGFGSQWMPLVITYGDGGASSYEINFGGYRTYGISSAASDANGYGTFEYAPPSGYYALCTKNLAEYG